MLKFLAESKNYLIKIAVRSFIEVGVAPSSPPSKRKSNHILKASQAVEINS